MKKTGHLEPTKPSDLRDEPKTQDFTASVERKANRRLGESRG
jgi:hypothetical protein